MSGNDARLVKVNADYRAGLRMSVKASRNELVVGERTDKSRIALPIIQYKGSEGPSVFIGAGIHGDELTGQASLWRLYEFLESKDIHGTITIMPVLNPDGLSFNVRGIPEAGVDLNRLFPGKVDGHISERITAKIWEIASKHDAIIDLHTFGPSIPVVLIDSVTGDLKQKMDRLAESTGMTVLEELPPQEYALQNLGASFGGAATAMKIPNITIELGGSKGIDWGSVEAGYLAIRNVLVDMGMVKGTMTRIMSSIVIHEKGYRRDDVYSEKGGLIEYTVKVGDKIRKGAILARIRDIFGDVVEEVKMPQDGYMISENYANVTQTGGGIATIAVKVKN
ncbi:MAG: succinylglutamate desuccinylase/aspartoacylase family protein [Methanomassiliicoccales archaeon]|nr:succinylglutamate desuccinylase/aspartoacylase family protein [Methanomassiliicoccales archaeon]